MRAEPKLSGPHNLIHVQIGCKQTTGLIDTGSSLTLISDRFFQKVKESTTEKHRFIEKPRTQKLIAANASPLKVQTALECDIRIAGIKIPASCIVIQNLTHDVIIGLDTLELAKAKISVHSRTLELYDGLIKVPLIDASRGGTAVTVGNINIPPYSKAIFPVRTKSPIPFGDYETQTHPMIPCKSILVAHAVVLNKPGRNEIPCCVINPTDKNIKFRKGTPIAMLQRAQVIENQRDLSTATTDSNVTIEQMQKELEARKISFTNTAVTGKDFEDLIRMLYDYRELFAVTIEDLPGCNFPPYRIETPGAMPIKSRPYRRSPQQDEAIDVELQKLLKAKIIKTSNSPWNSNLVLIMKADKSIRFCCDYRKLNSLVPIQSTNLPDFTRLTDQIAQQQPTWFVSADLKSGFWQQKLDPQSAPKTAFCHRDQVYEWNVMPFGICTAPQAFHGHMSALLKDFRFTLVFLDDLLIMGNSPRDLLEKTKLVFDKLREARLRLHGQKCQFATTKICFLGHVFQNNTMSINPQKLEIIKTYPAPTNVKQLKSFLGLSSFYRRFLKDYSHTTYPLRLLLRKEQKFVWSTDCQQAFESIKASLISSPILRMPNFSLPFTVMVDASRKAVGFHLLQRINGRLHAICYSGKALQPNQRFWSICDLEAYALVCAVQTYSVYLSHMKFTVLTDHIALVNLQRMRLSENSRLVRWSMFLTSYCFDIKYKKGTKNLVADALSRRPWPQDEYTPTIEEKMTDSTEDTPGPECLPLAPISLADESNQRHERTYIEFQYDTVTVGAASVPVIGQLPSLEDVRDSIRACPDFADIFWYLSNGQLSDDNKIARRVILQAPDYVLENQVLYHLYSPRTKHLQRAKAIIKQLAIPTALRHRIAIQLHNANCHPGHLRLFETVRNLYYWPQMYTYLKKHVDTCFDCQQAKRPINPEKTEILGLPSAEPALVWTADYHGKFPFSDGKQFILTFIDHSSMYPELIATESCDSDTMVQSFFDNIVARHGLPRGLILRTDNAAAFVSSVTKSFTQTFGITQVFSTPHHHQPITRAEAFADTLNKTLRILCNKQHDWIKHLQAIAMGYRSTCTSNSGLSPHEVFYGRPFRLPITLSLMDEVPAVPNLESYVTQLEPKLAILREIAQQNVDENAKRLRDQKNKTATSTTFRNGQKVFLHDPTTKTGQNAKLKRRYTGPFIVTETLENHNFKLKHLVSGTELKRPVHASRMRPLKEMDNDYRLRDECRDICMFAGKTAKRQLEIKIVVGNIAKINADILVSPTDAELSHSTGAASAIAKAAGQDLVEECKESIAANGPLEVASPLATTAGALQPHVQKILHIVDPNATKGAPLVGASLLTKTLQQTYYACLSHADKQPEVNKLAIPVIGIGILSADTWTSLHALGTAIKQFDDDTASTQGSLKTVKFVALSLTVADIAVTIFRSLLSTDGSSTPNVTEDTSEQPISQQTDAAPAPVTSPADDWHPIEKLLRHRRFKGREQFLVKWQAQTPDTWLDRADISDPAIQHYYATRLPKRRRRRQ